MRSREPGQQRSPRIRARRWKQKRVTWSVLTTEVQIMGGGGKKSKDASGNRNKKG